MAINECLNKNCKTCKDWECRCESCGFLVEGYDGSWLCDQNEKRCADILVCPEYKGDDDE